MGWAGYSRLVSVAVRRAGGQVDHWRAIPGVTRWVDYSSDRTGDDLLVYVHSFRRTRERMDGAHDVLMWKPTSTGLGHRYAAGEWDEVLEEEQSWPPYDLEMVPRGRDRRRPRAR